MKFIPSECGADGRKYYQFTAADECTMRALRELYKEHSIFNAKIFLIKLIKSVLFSI